MSARTPICAAEAAELLECDARTARRWIELGVIRGERVGRRWLTTLASVEAFRARLCPPRTASARARR